MGNETGVDRQSEDCAGHCAIQVPVGSAETQLTGMKLDHNPGLFQLSTRSAGRRALTTL
jgi:hypothetical protein